MAKCIKCGQNCEPRGGVGGYSGNILQGTGLFYAPYCGCLTNKTMAKEVKRITKEKWNKLNEQCLKDFGDTLIPH